MNWKAAGRWQRLSVRHKCFFSIHLKAPLYSEFDFTVLAASVEFLYQEFWQFILRVSDGSEHQVVRRQVAETLAVTQKMKRVVKYYLL